MYKLLHNRNRPYCVLRLSLSHLGIEAQLLVCNPLFVSQLDAALAIQNAIDDLDPLRLQISQFTDTLHTRRRQQ